jgi:hypothetical protein
MLNAAAIVVLFVAAQSPEDLGVGAPLSGPSAADLGVDTSASSTALSTGGEADVAVEPARGRSLGGGDPVERAVRFRVEVDAVLADLNPDTHALLQRLDGVVGTWVPDNVYAVDVALRPLHRLVKVRALALAGRVDDADAALRDATRAADPAVRALEPAAARRLQAAVRFGAALVVEARARAELTRPACGPALGLRRLAQDEARARRRLLDDVAAAYLPVARGADRFWARRAAFQVARLYEDVARRTDLPGSLRTATLPSPYAIDVIDTGALLQPVLDGWFGEIRRSYAEVAAAVDAREPDAELALRARERADALARYTPDDTPALHGERVENPWLAALHEGLVRVSGRPERRNAQGRFVPVETRAAVAAMTNALDNPGDVDNAFALVGLARLSPSKVPVEALLAALGHADERVVVAALTAVVDVVVAEGGAARATALREAVVAAWAGGSDDAKHALFSTAQRALYGRGERSLLALQAIARVDRESADLLAADERLPAVERAWIVAELADARFAGHFDEWAWDKDERTAALATWGGYVARRQYAGYLLRPQAEGLVGCASRAAQVAATATPAAPATTER